MNNSKISKKAKLKQKIKAVHNESVLYMEPKATRNQILLEK